MSTAPVVQVAGTGAQAATHTTASFTPPANTRLVAFVASYKGSAGVVLPTISDTSGLTWTQLLDFVNSSFSVADVRGTWFISSSVGASPAAMTVTVTTVGGNSIGVTIASVLNADVSGSTVQVKTAEDLVNGDPILTFSAAPGATNITLLGTAGVGGNSFTVPAGYTALSNAAHSTARRHATSYDITSAAISPQYVSTNTRVVMLGIELAPAGAPAGRLKAWGGSAWALKPAKVWSGSSWITKPVKVWNGSAWT